jgi:flagellar motor protein MotB
VNLDSQHHPQEADDDETPWLSFSDAVTALLFVFIATTFWFMFRLEQARSLLEQRIDERAEELKKLRGADVAASDLLEGVGVCLAERRSDGVRVRPVVEESTRTMSLYIEPQASTIVEWFQVCSAEITRDAAVVVSMARDCLAAEVPALTEDYTVILTLEGHTDARVTGAGECRSRFPSNWELSGARAGAALRRLMCVDGSCDEESIAEAGKLRDLAQDRDRLQLVAAGRAESMPAWRALCAPDWSGAAVDAGLDSAVCTALGETGGTSLDRTEMVTGLIRNSPIAGLASLNSFDEALVAWANDPRCVGAAGLAVSCDERFRRLRRVDMRVDLRPRTAE